MNFILDFLLEEKKNLIIIFNIEWLIILYLIINYYEIKEYIRLNCWIVDICNIYNICNSVLCIKGWEFDNIGKRVLYYYFIIIVCIVVCFDF